MIRRAPRHFTICCHQVVRDALLIRLAVLSASVPDMSQHRWGLFFLLGLTESYCKQALCNAFAVDKKSASNREVPHPISGRDGKSSVPGFNCGRSGLLHFDRGKRPVDYYGGKELAESFRTVRKNTLAIAQDIPEDQYGFRVTPETRSVSELLAHIAISPTFNHKVHAEQRLKTLAGFDFASLMQRMQTEEKEPRTKAQIIELLTESGERWATWVEGLHDDFLGEVIEMPPGGTPPRRTRFDMILSVKEHEMHHRGQLMLVERQLGIVPHLTRRIQERANAAAQRK